MSVFSSTLKFMFVKYT